VFSASCILKQIQELRLKSRVAEVGFFEQKKAALNRNLCEYGCMSITMAYTSLSGLQTLKCTQIQRNSKFCICYHSFCSHDFIITLECECRDGCACSRDIEMISLQKCTALELLKTRQDVGLMNHFSSKTGSYLLQDCTVGWHVHPGRRKI
jgi:hypothetical protein